jgi:K+-sensing histidine kinase KdpD
VISKFDVRRKIIHPLFGLTARADGSGTKPWVRAAVGAAWLASLLGSLILAPIAGRCAFLLTWPPTMLVTWRSGFKAGALLGVVAVAVFGYFADPSLDPDNVRAFMLLGSVLLVFIIMVSLMRSAQLQWQRALQRSESRERLLLELTAAFSQATTPHQVAQVIVDQAVGALGGHSGSVVRCTAGSPLLETLAGLNVPQTLQSPHSYATLDAHMPISDTVRLGAPLWIESREELAARYTHLLNGNGADAQIQALACLPLIAYKRVVGALAIGFPMPRHMNMRERNFLVRMADLCAQALERARLYEDEQRAHHQAEEANQLKMKFLGMVSHELRTPLTSIKGFSSTLLADDVTWEPERQRDFIATIDEESDKLTELVDQLLDLSRLQAGTLPIHPEPKSLVDVFELAHAQLQVLAHEHTLVVDVPAGLPPARVDGARIAQVLANLVENAAKFSPRGSCVTVTARRREGGHGLRVSVADEGPGIPADARDYVFEPFRQVDQPNRSTLRGAGLGLAICRGIVEAHDGQIWVEEHPGPGTTITFTLPDVG